MNPILTELLSNAWLISSERKSAYASLLLSLMKGESLSDSDSSFARERNRSFVICGSAEQPQRFGYTDASIPEGSVAVIPIRSEILKYDQPCGPRGSQSILGDVKQADQNPNIRSILLIVDSPGGQVTGTDLLADAIAKCETPVVAYIEGMAASAAYWIISGARRIIASSDLDRIGSIGTMLLVEDLKPALEKLGVKFHEIYASLSTDKNQDFNQAMEGDYDPLRKNMLDVINGKFLSMIKTNRPGLDESTLTGKSYFAQEAIRLGLIDEIGSYESALEAAFSFGPSPLVQAISNETKIHQTMKIKQTWKAIQGFFKLDPATLETQELSVDQMQQLNDKLDSMAQTNEQLEQALQSEKQAHEATLAELRELQAQDATRETVAAKLSDSFPGDGKDPVVYAHDKIADEFCAQ
ncbi:MAG: S49 family peptidase [Alphaproteobacteria bacterium]|nr:S49 family peptidase [Alphaproteobacteria bacterium]